MDYVLQQSFLLSFVAETAKDLLEPDQAVENGFVVVFVLADLDRFHDAEHRLI